MIATNLPDTRYYQVHNPDADRVVGNPAGLIKVGAEVEFHYGRETVTAVETDGDWVTLHFADVPPALFLACDTVWVRA